jgi:H+/Cl- antiporter ClcA
MRKIDELRLRHWRRVEQLGFWRYTLLCSVGYGGTIALMLAFAVWQRVPRPDWIRLSMTALPLVLIGGFVFGVVGYYMKTWLYRRSQRRTSDSATTNI